jgi:hypothetical protein
MIHIKQKPDHDPAFDQLPGTFVMFADQKLNPLSIELGFIQLCI